MPFINEFSENDSIYDQFLVVAATKGSNNVGSPYLSVTLQDKTGTIEGKVWSVTPYELEVFEVGNIVNVDATVISYKDKLQLKILNSEKLDAAKVDINKFAIACPVPQEILVKKLDSLIESIKDEELHNVVNSIINENRKEFLTAPAAVRNHHEHLSGLLLHTVSMAEIADYIAKYYDNINRDLLISGVLLHDVGKLIELSGPAAAKYTLEGRLIGHISIMHTIVKEKCIELKVTDEKRILLEHMVLSHHGQYDFGSPVLPMTKEALLLNMIDDMDAKMNTLNKALATTKEGEFTPKIFPLDDRAFYKPGK